jgi:hypothetical protein
MRGRPELGLGAHITFRDTRCNENAIEQDVKRKISENAANESTRTTTFHSTRLFVLSGAWTNLQRDVGLCAWSPMPRQCEEVALPEQAINRDPEAYHRHGRTQAQKARRHWARRRRQPLVAPRLLTGVAYASCLPAHTLSSSPLSREPAPAGATTGRLLMPLGLPTQVSVPTSTQLRTKCCESAAKRWICDARGSRAGTHLWRTSVPRA